MNSTIMVQKSAKDLALARARKEGFTLNSVANILLRDYATGKLNIGSFSHAGGGQAAENFSVDAVNPVDLDGETQTLVENLTEKWREKVSK